MPLGISAQSLQKKGTSVESLVPEGWTYNHEKGDLNKDGIDDLVLVATPHDKDKQKVRDDGYVYDFNQPQLAIYFGSSDGSYTLWNQYPEILPVCQDEFGSIDISPSITKRGTLQIYIDCFFSVGSTNTPKQTYVFRYQNNDFYLIGEETREFSRTTGEDVACSYNYLTNKCCKTTKNGFDDSVKPRTKWTTLPKEPLKRLGSWEL